ncbi:TetR/AcrR family transcriptional regulator [Phenylobacterium sp.]|jgi:AcrR family transcriptional regulator|uniref:TetR/AcrR family transcriptional regulator n=1 Tax=Phenylobacterium sp. TaxID=1871053 RepID=UPI002E303807|nr:TetR/AcrR family transcriptional regulator [Phenylobacterium sp.]HEX2559635.1 TetR/AcrR family transcriptional regulator [Phenylobacterium sp.]
MSAKPQVRPHPPRSCYHLGNVRSQLLTAARDILEAQGKEALSLRAISIRAGVALGTIYHHYESKHALLAGLAVEGFEELARRMREALEHRGEASGLRAAGYAYIGFLCDRPALYRLMFESVDQGRTPEVMDAEDRAFQVIAEAIPIGAGRRTSPAVSEQVAMAIWAWGRGIAAVGFSRGAPGEPPRRSALDAALAGLEAIFASGANSSLAGAAVAK